jgi:ABC-type multidrug transport system fused ATPase/permease subunit
VTDLNQMRLLAGFLPLLAAAIGVFFGLMVARRSRADEAERAKRRNELQEKESQLAAEAAQGQLDLATLWAVTQERIDFYHDIAIKQSRRSFFGGQLATWFGFLAVIGLGVFAASAKSATAAIAAGASALGAGALSAFIGATFLRSQTESSAQLRQFFSQPVEFIRILGAERLVETLDGNQRAAAVQQIIKSMTPVGTPELPEAPKDEEKKK